MEQTEFHYLITFSKLFLKLGTGQNTSEECTAIKSFSEDTTISALLITI